LSLSFSAFAGKGGETAWDPWARVANQQIVDEAF